MDGSLLTFLGISAAVIATPGPDTLLTVRNTFLGGKRAGMATALGVSAGQVIWSVATSLGLVALLLASGPAFQALKLAGAAYLVYLGVQSLTAALRRPPPPEADVGHVRGGRLGGVRAFGQGIVNNLANPKMAVFFASVLPQFAPASPGTLMALLSLGLGFSALTCVWLTLYAAVGARAGPSLRGSRAGRAIQGTTGLTLIGLGLKVATEKG